MKFKLDENLGARTQRLFHAAGHEVETVCGEGIQGCSDQHLYDLCCAEDRCLVTLDLDFADVIRFPSTKASGIVIIRVPRNPSLVLLEQLVDRFLKALDRAPLERHLWIVEVGRIRIHQSEENE
jgi:predicted nuclease of predicted toxin-antitoxin system